LFSWLLALAVGRPVDKIRELVKNIRGRQQPA
jgi:hypothetical protein